MLKYRVKTNSGTIDVWLDATNPNERALLQYSKQDPAFTDWLASQSGAFGHLIGKATTPIDLHYVMNAPQSRRYKPTLISGTIDRYDPDIPDDAVS